TGTASAARAFVRRDSRDYPYRMRTNRRQVFDLEGIGAGGKHQRDAGRADTPLVPRDGLELSTADHDHPHSLKPHTWHLMHPSANSSCEPQSGQAPEKVSCMPPSIICSPPPMVTRETTGAASASAGAGAPGSSSCWMPCFSCIQ